MTGGGWEKGQSAGVRCQRGTKTGQNVLENIIGRAGGWVVGINRPFSSFLLRKARRYFRPGVLGVAGVARSMGTGGAEVTKV